MASPAKKKPLPEPAPDLTDHERLRRAWKRVEDERPISQKALASLARVSPGAISQFLTGKTKLNVEWQLRFADYLGLPVAEIWPDFQFARQCASDLPPDAIDVARNWLKVPSSKRDLLAQLIRESASK